MVEVGTAHPTCCPWTSYPPDRTEGVPCSR